MKIKVKVNNEKISIAEVHGKGHLGVHINLDGKKNKKQLKMAISISGYDTNNPEETKYLEWKTKSLKAGDLIQVEIMPTDTADKPKNIKISSENPKAIAVNIEQAEKILNVAYSCNKKLGETLSELKLELDEEVFMELAYGVGSVMNEIFASIAEPIYRKNPSTVPDELKDLPL